MKKILFSLLALPLTANAVTWGEIGVGRAVDLDKITENTGWGRFAPSQTRNGMFIKYKFNCETQKMGLAASYIYSKEGVLLKNIYIKDKDVLYREIPDGAVGKTLIRVFCNKDVQDDLRKQAEKANQQ